jgi:D-3-phosphoglycerate dehydrogenase / 2-oxoglutarate reductase
MGLAGSGTIARHSFAIGPRRMTPPPLTPFADPGPALGSPPPPRAPGPPMNIIILDDYQDAVRKLRCASRLDNLNAKVFTNTVKGIGQLSVRLRDADILVLIRERTHFPRALLEKLPKLKLIAQTGRVGPHIDVATCTRMGIAVAEGVGSPVAPAELTWALIMAAMRRLPHYIGTLKHGAWQQSGLKSASMPPNFGMGMVLRGRTLGVWGYGKIGQLVAGYGRAFGMRVIVWGSESSRVKAQADGHQPAISREAFFEESDVLSLHLRLTEETRGIVTLDDLQRMKPTAIFVNTSRAELVQENALVTGLNRGRPGMAAVDVFETEPILQGHPLLRLENAVCTPHIGYVEQDSYELYFGAAFDNVINFIRNEPTNLVNPEALKVMR